MAWEAPVSAATKVVRTEVALEREIGLEDVTFPEIVFILKVLKLNCSSNSLPLLILLSYFVFCIFHPVFPQFLFNQT